MRVHLAEMLLANMWQILVEITISVRNCVHRKPCVFDASMLQRENPWDGSSLMALKIVASQ